MAQAQVSVHPPQSTLATPTATVEVSSVQTVPVGDGMAGYLEGQATFIHDVFFPGQEPAAGELVVLRLAHSPFDESVPKPANAALWTFRAFAPYHYDWAEAQIPADKLAELGRIRGQASLVIAALKGPMGMSPVLAIVVSALDGQGARGHAAIPVIRLSDEIYQMAVEAESARGSGLPPDDPFRYYSEEVGPCDSWDDFYCNNTYRQRLGLALSQFGSCMAGLVPPVGLQAVSCFVLCAPLIASSGGGIYVYKICVEACLAGVGTGVIPQVYTCAAVLQNQEANAKTSYCGCLKYKEDHCLDRAEPDTVGCP